MFRITVDIDADWQEITPPILEPEEYEEQVKSGLSAVAPGVGEEDVSVYLETDPEI